MSREKASENYIECLEIYLQMGLLVKKAERWGRYNHVIEASVGRDRVLQHLIAFASV